MKPKYNENIDSCYMDTNRIIYDVPTENPYEDIKVGLQEKSTS